MSAAVLQPCCAAVVERYRIARAGDPRDGARLYCSDCTSRIAVTVTLVFGERVIWAQTEVA